LLQVLVSIQSMILVELPYFNEPGMGQAVAKHSASDSYNKNIMLQTTKWAIVDWLGPERKNSMWADVIFSHFTIRQAKIRECITTWAKSEKRIRKYTIASAGDTLNIINPSRGSRNNSSSQSTSDLIAAFDQGMECIRGWQTDDS